MLLDPLQRHLASLRATVEYCKPVPPSYTSVDIELDTSTGKLWSGLQHCEAVFFSNSVCLYNQSESDCTMHTTHHSQTHEGWGRHLWSEWTVSKPRHYRMVLCNMSLICCVYFSQRVINASKDNQHMHIIPPSTPFFSIQYTKQVSIAPLIPDLSSSVHVYRYDLSPEESIGTGTEFGHHRTVQTYRMEILLRLYPNTLQGTYYMYM